MRKNSRGWETYAMCVNSPRSSIEQSSNLRPCDGIRKPDATIQRGNQTETSTRHSTAKPYARFRSKSLSLVQSGKSESGNSCFRTGVGIPLYMSRRLSRKLHRDIRDKELFPPIFVSFRTMFQNCQTKRRRRYNRISFT